jgi:hypothetical protein
MCFCINGLPAIRGRKKGFRMKKNPVFPVLITLFVLSACNGKPVIGDRHNSGSAPADGATGAGIVGTMVAKTLTAIPTITLVPSSTLVPTLIPGIDWLQHSIELYGLTLSLPSDWRIQEINRRPAPTNSYDPITGHDCADYQISSPDNLSILTLQPICGFSEGFPGEYPADTIIINPMNGQAGIGSFKDNTIGRFFNGTEYSYSHCYLLTYEDLTGSHETNVCTSPPVMAYGYGEGKDFVWVGINLKYAGPGEQIANAFAIVDKIVLSIAKYSK